MPKSRAKYQYLLFESDQGLVWDFVRRGTTTMKNETPHPLLSAK